MGVPQSSTPQSVTWDQTTPGNKSLTVYAVGYQSALITINTAGTINAGGIVFEGSDGVTWYGLRATERYTGTSDQSYGLANGPAAITCEISGFTQFRVRLLTPISGSGAASIDIAQSTVSSPNSINQNSSGGAQTNVNLNQVGGAAFALGQTTKSGSLSVTLASDQGAIAVTGGGGTEYTDGGTPPANPVGGAIIYDKSGAWADVGVDNPLPTTANQGTPGATAWLVNDDMTNFQPIGRTTLATSTDTTFTFAQPVRLVRVKNFDINNVVLVANGAIASDTSTSAERVGVAPVANVPSVEYYPYKTTTIHLRSAGASTSVDVTGFF